MARKKPMNSADFLKEAAGLIEEERAGARLARELDYPGVARALSERFDAPPGRIESRISDLFPKGRIMEGGRPLSVARQVIEGHRRRAGRSVTARAPTRRRPIDGIGSPAPRASPKGGLKVRRSRAR